MCRCRIGEEHGHILCGGYRWQGVCSGKGRGWVGGGQFNDTVLSQLVS
jgi:hypothetical protein